MIRIDELVLNNFRKRYSCLHPLIFHRSVEKARDAANLFDILEGVPNKYTVVWDENTKSWRHEADVILGEQLKDMRKKRD